MWLPSNIIAEVDRLAVVSYIDQTATRAWNSQRTEGELRLLTGWCWAARKSGACRQGFKTPTVAYRDAYYALIRDQQAPYVAVPTRKRRAA